MEFKNSESEKLIKKPPKRVAKTKVHKGVQITIGNVKVYLKNGTEDGVIVSDKVMTIAELIESQKSIKGFVNSIDPPMYSIFQSSVDGILEPYVAVGDRVRYTKAVFMPEGAVLEDEYTVTKVELSSLGNMSVFTAALDNGEAVVLTNVLKKV